MADVVVNLDKFRNSRIFVVHVLSGLFFFSEKRSL